MCSGCAKKKITCVYARSRRAEATRGAEGTAAPSPSVQESPDDSPLFAQLSSVDGEGEGEEGAELRDGVQFGHEIDSTMHDNIDVEINLDILPTASIAPSFLLDIDPQNSANLDIDPLFANLLDASSDPSQWFLIPISRPSTPVDDEVLQAYDKMSPVCVRPLFLLNCCLILVVLPLVALPSLIRPRCLASVVLLPLSCFRCLFFVDFRCPGLRCLVFVSHSLSCLRCLPFAALLPSCLGALHPPLWFFLFHSVPLPEFSPP